MQVEETERLRRAWGNKVCSHDDVDKEFSREIPTGQFTCIVCGKTFWLGTYQRNKEHPR